MIARAPALRMLGTGAAAIAVASGVWALRTWDPNVPGNPFLPCLFNVFTGLYCPGCGITRCLHALAHGDVLRAVDFNALVVFVLVAVPLMIAGSRGWRPRALQAPMRMIAMPLFWLVLIPAFTLARNLPWAPFAWLAP